MAYGALVSLAQTVDQILNHDNYSLSHHQRQQITAIHEYVFFLQAFLEHFPDKANNNNNKSLEGQIRYIANQAENTIEYFMWEQRRLLCGIVTSCGGRRPSEEKSVHHYSRLASDLDKLTEKIDSIAQEAMNVKNKYFVIKEIGTVDSSSRLAQSTPKKDVVTERICGESSKLQVIPIVGMGGIGKTTLATNAYQDPLVIENFMIRAWVTVSQDYSPQKVVSSLVDSMKELINTERYRGESDEEKVYKCLKGMKYLIVMDDVWSTEAWDDVRMIFPDENNGSRVVLTTRLLDVAAYVDSSSLLHEMQLMNADQSWDLLRHRVFEQGPLCPLELEGIGKEIAGSCRGLPLAIVVIAGLLSTVSKTRASWEKIAGNVKSAINATKHGQLEKIMSLSYTHLPHHLRPCFLYMGAFPEDQEIHVQKLIRLWVGEGFLKYPNGSKTVEEAAEEYLEDLVKRSLVLVSKRKFNGKIKSCRLHDLMRELCIRKSQQERFLRHAMVKNQRRVCIDQSNLSFLENIYGSTTRTILCLMHSEISSLGCLRHFRFLRVLDLVFAYNHRRMFDSEEVASLPPQVFELFHLRYLAFSYAVEIPRAVSNLQNLQTLIIYLGTKFRYRPSTVRLPSEIWRMPQLRHLICFNFDQLPDPHQESEITRALLNLQTLSRVRNLKCTETIMKMIPNVKKLGIFYSEDKYKQEYHLENLVHLQNLVNLKLTVRANLSFPNKSLNFPQTLKKLSLSGESLPWQSTMMSIGSLPNLQVLKLRNYCGYAWKTSDGGFPELEFLLIESSDLRHWITESDHFPSLKWLLLRHCEHLREIPDAIGEIPTLQLIEVKGGSASLFESAKGIQEEQQSWGNEALQVRCIEFRSQFQSFQFK
ncbi:hypothetical protein MIMGU_mgv1a020452mg [Erythranthe guttata]|uniref:Uncharacterized protein n=1 Tax=Erythranthe guttata TaxID=4155 RepID=A0A022Q7A0_ERYGU|nr:hypothetical protein MIMGU_mgv1a020452mg [Erythranthe guttata]